MLSHSSSSTSTSRPGSLASIAHSRRSIGAGSDAHITAAAQQQQQQQQQHWHERAAAPPIPRAGFTARPNYGLDTTKAYDWVFMPSGTINSSDTQRSLHQSTGPTPQQCLTSYVTAVGSGGGSRLPVTAADLANSNHGALMGSGGYIGGGDNARLIGSQWRFVPPQAAKTDPRDVTEYYGPVAGGTVMTEYYGRTVDVRQKHSYKVL
ncbi:hypothetical protein FOA52_016189 [Chlamydomonas sp. UWO 241]|nr:hypothetical protein FOA52_016189 [Chlamydomonas sp. UWO 241]